MTFHEQHPHPGNQEPNCRSQNEIDHFQRSFVILKPTNFRLIPEIGAIIEESGLEIIRGTSLKVSKQQAEDLYEDHLGKDYYSSLISITSGEAFLFEVVGNDAISVVRKHVICKVRQRFGINQFQDIVHAPDSLVAYYREASVLSL